MREKQTAYIIFIGEPEGNRAPGRPRHFGAKSSHIFMQSL
jgi:hypothetical protein